MLKVNRETFLQQLEMISPGLSQREILEQSSCFVFDKGRILSFNDEISCSHETKLQIKGAVQAQPLLAILRKLEEQELEIEQVNGELILHGKRKKSGIRMEAQITLPIDQLETPMKWRPLPQDFTEAVSMTQHCAGKDAANYWPLCFNITPNWIETSDTFQIARYELETGFKEPLLVRRDSLVHIIKLDMVEFSTTSSWVHFRNKSGLVLSCRSESAEFPDCTPFLKGKGQKTVLPKTLIRETEAAEIFSTESAGDNLITIQLWPGKLKLKGEGVFGWYSSYKTLKKYQGPAMKFMISPTLLAQIIGRHNECELVTEGENRRLIVRGENFKYSACLVRINEKEKE
jgi:DNA polymerase III sliding clamp (beta) subunit (PCNA family)